MLNLDEIRLELKRNLSNYRYEHSIRVAEEAKKLANHYKVNEEEAYLAGLLHDITKEFSDEANEYWVNKYKLPKFLLESNYKKTCHAEIGAVVARELYKVNDNISQAIRYHTIGNINMTMLDKIVFVADKIESGKYYNGIDEEREMAYQDIDKALILCLQNNKEKLEKEGKLFNKESEKVLNYFLTK